MHVKSPKVAPEAVREYAELRKAHLDLIRPDRLVMMTDEEHKGVLLPLIQWMDDHHVDDLVTGDKLVIEAYIAATDTDREAADV